MQMKTHSCWLAGRPGADLTEPERIVRRCELIDQNQPIMELSWMQGIRPLPDFFFKSRIPGLLACLVIWLGTPQPVPCDEIVLRSGQKLDGIQAVDIDEDGVMLEGGQRIGLERIQAASLEHQQRFDQVHQRLGLDLFRVMIRVQKKDYENLEPHLNRVYPIYVGRTSRTAAVVHAARYHLSILLGKWDQAIESCFRIHSCIAANAADRRFLDSLNLNFEADTGMSPDICPFGYEKKSIVENWSNIVAAYRSLPDRHPTGLDFYFYSLAYAASMDVPDDLATRRIAMTHAERVLLEVIPVSYDQEATAGDREQARIRLTEFEPVSEKSPIQQALYRLAAGLLEIRRNGGDSNTGLLELLRIHAEFGSRTSMISAASLWETYQVLQDREPKKDAKSVARELKTRYPSSIFAKKLKMKSMK